MASPYPRCALVEAPKTDSREEFRYHIGKMANIIGEVIGAAAAVARGMGVTMKEMMSPTVTENYPDEPPKLQERFRGIHVLQRDENGLEKCVACFLCAAACPSNCIYIEAAENTDQVRISGGERYAKVYNIDYNRCIFCGYCVEACPTDAITHGHGFEVASYNTSTLVYTKEDMLAPIPAGAKPPVIREVEASGH
jgi:NADH-quinone oxidoreductase subunit I